MARSAREVLPRVGFFSRGYDIGEVTEVIDAAREAAADRRGARSRPGAVRGAHDLRAASFRMRRRGYEPRAVDRLLESWEDRLAATGPGEASADDLADSLIPRLERPEGERFSAPRMRRRGYSLAQVDHFLEQVIAALEARATLHPAEVRAATFAAARGQDAYDEAVVDVYLDRVVEWLQAEKREG